MQHNRTGGYGQRSRCLAVGSAEDFDRAAADGTRRSAEAGIGRVIQHHTTQRHAAGLSDPVRICLNLYADGCGPARLQEVDTSPGPHRPACASDVDIKEGAARGSGVGDADRRHRHWQGVHPEADVAQIKRARHDRDCRRLDGAGDHQRRGVHGLREAGGVAVRAREDDRLRVDARRAGGEGDIKRRCVARTNLAKATNAAVAERRVAAGGERTAQPVGRAASRVEQPQIGRQSLPGDGGAEIEGEDIARLAHAAGAGQLAESRGGVVVDGDGDRHIDKAQVGVAEAVDPGAVADGLHRDLAADGAGRRGGDADAQGRRVAAAGGDVRRAAGGIQAAGRADDRCVQAFRPDAGRRGVGGGQRLGEGSAVVADMQIHVGRRGDGRRGLVEDVAGDRDGLRRQDDRPAGAASVGVVNADIVHAVVSRVVASGQGQHGAVGRGGRQRRILDPAMRGCVAQRNDIGAAEPDVQVAGVLPGAVIPEADVVAVARHGVQGLGGRSVLTDIAQGQEVGAVERGDPGGSGRLDTGIAAGNRPARAAKIEIAVEHQVRAGRGRTRRQRQDNRAAECAGLRVVDAHGQAGTVRLPRRQAVDVSRTVDVAAHRGRRGIQRGIARVGDAECRLVIRRPARRHMRIGQHNRLRRVDHRIRQDGVGQHGAGHQDRFRRQRLREARRVRVGRRQRNDLAERPHARGREVDRDLRAAAGSQRAENTKPAIGEGRVPVGAEHAGQPVGRGADRCRIGDIQGGEDVAAAEAEGAEVEGVDRSALRQRAGAGRLLDRHRGVVVDDRIDRHGDRAEIGCAERVDAGAVAGRLHIDGAADGSGGGGRNPDRQGRGVAAARCDIGCAAGGAEQVSALVGHARVQTLGVGPGRRGVGDGQRLGDAAAAIPGVEVDSGRGDRGRCLIEHVAGYRDGLGIQPGDARVH